MKLIKKLSPKYINGRCVSYGIFWCIGCKEEVEKRLGNGKIAKSCGKNECNFTIEKKQKLSINTKGKNNPMYGKIHSEISKEKIRKTKINKKYAEEVNMKKGKKGEDHPFFGKFGIEHPMYGKKHTNETIQKIRDGNIGKIVSEETRQKMREAKKGQYIGKNNPNWQNGKSFEIYPIEFKQIKKFILERDNYTCQYSGCIEIHDRLHVHHIDYDKTNNNPENLITLGTSCHSKTIGKNRAYWIEFYQNIMMNRVMECLL